MRKPPTTAPRRCGSPTTCAARTCCCWPGPTPKPPNYPGGSRPGSPQMGTVGPPQAALSDGNQAGIGDLVRARLNTEIDAGGRTLTNRDTLKITALAGPDAEVRRQRLDGTWTGPFRVPRSYLARHAELAYGGNVHVAQGRTVDTAHLLVTEHPVPAGPVRRHDPRPRGQHRARRHRQDRPARARAVPAGRPRIRARRRPAARRRTTCPPPSRSARPRNGPGEPATCSHLWSAAVRQALYPDIDEQITARLTESEAWRYEREHSRQVPAAAAPRCPARRARHQRAHRPDHRRADGRRPVHLQRPARPPPAPAAARRCGTRRDVGAADTARRSGAGARAGRRARRPGPRTRRAADRQPRAVAGPPARVTARPGRLPCPARGLRPAGRHGRGLPGSRRDHRPAAGRELRPASGTPNSKPCARTRSGPWRSPTKGRDPGHDPRRARGPGPRKANAPRRPHRRT